MNQPTQAISDRPRRTAHARPSVRERRSTGAFSFVGHIRLKTSATLGDSWPDRRPQLEGNEMFDKQSLERQMKRASGQSGRLASWRAALMAVTVLTAAGFVLAGGTWLGPHGDSAMAREFKDQPGRTQSGTRVDFSSLKDWNLKAENIVPSGGNNPLYFPLKPGFRYIMEHPNHPHGTLADRRPGSRQDRTI